MSNDELTLHFLSNYLVTDSSTKLSDSFKHIIGCIVVHGENDDLGIYGVFLVRWSRL